MLLEHLRPFVRREMERLHGNDWRERVDGYLRAGSVGAISASSQWSVGECVAIVNASWNQCFRKRLSDVDRSMLSEAAATQRRWDAEEVMSGEDAYRILDTVQRLLIDLDAPAAAEQADRIRQQVLQERQRSQARRAREAAQRRSSTAGEPREGLLPWRQIVEPHPDVAAGRFAQAEFAADLAKVHRGDGGEEYGDPRQFFRRTFLTQGLRSLLLNAMRRLCGNAGDPVIELQTNFGGGKTHSMLALYHLTAPGVSPHDLAGIEDLLAEVGIDAMPRVARAVLVGTAISPGERRTKPDGTVVQTLWGEMAWQLGASVGRAEQAFGLVAENDVNRTPPGSDRLVELFKMVGASLILIDEWVAYIRHTYERTDQPGGSFDSNLTFAQSLTEAASGVDNVLLVASLPQSDIESGGDGGVQALKRLENTFGRKESNWKPADTDESYEIVRRRLFEPIPAERKRDKDAVSDAFVDLYRKNQNDFPADSRAAGYRQRLDSAYPIHPELFERLYNDWSTLEQFQRTRGVLRLMAKVIHTLWARGDQSLLIMPGTIPIDEQAVEHELVRYLPEVWSPILQSEVDGSNALATRTDSEKPAYGRYWAARRVARTVYVGSAPTLQAANRGIDLDRIRLGCVQPGESTPTFGDALGALQRQSTHLYAEQSRYWYSTEANVTRVANDRAERYDEAEVDAAIVERLRSEQKKRALFGRVHACPVETSDVPDDDEARLVILGPETAHTSGGNVTNSSAMSRAWRFFQGRGDAPRLSRNTIVFAAADVARLAPLRAAARQLAAWRSVIDEADALNLNPHNRRLAEKNLADAERTFVARLPEAYCWLIVPVQDSPAASVELQASRLGGAGSIAERCSQRLRRDEAMLENFAGVPLKLALDRIDWHGKDALSVKQVMEWFAQYVYFPRLQTTKLVIRAIEDGVSKLTWRSDSFAYASRWDEEAGRYQGLCAGEQPQVLADGSDLIVRSEVAAKQFERESEQPDLSGGRPSPNSRPQSSPSVGDAVTTGGRPASGSSGGSSLLRRKGFYGRFSSKAATFTRDAHQAVQNVVAHLGAAADEEVSIVIEIRARSEDGFDDATTRTVSENCRTLKFDHFEFED